MFAYICPSSFAECGTRLPSKLTGTLSSGVPLQRDIGVNKNNHISRDEHLYDRGVIISFYILFRQKFVISAIPQGRGTPGKAESAPSLNTQYLA